MNVKHMRQQLLRRIKENYAVYQAKLFQKDKQELIDEASCIAKTAEVYRYFSENRLSESEIEYFLKFQNPLEVVADHWNCCDFGQDALGALISDVVDKEDDLVDYPLILSSYSPVKECLFLDISSMPDALMGKGSKFIVVPKMVEGKLLVPVTVEQSKDNKFILKLEEGCFISGKEVNEDYQIIAKVRVGPVEYALGEIDAKIPFFVTWERTPANDDDGPPNYYWGHYFDNRGKAIQDFCNRASEKYEALMEMHKSSSPTFNPNPTQKMNDTEVN